MKKKLFLALLVALLVCFGFSSPAFAANKVSNINIDVVLYDDGSAQVTQTWDGSFTEGTEAYIPIQNLGELSISDFRVSGPSGAYANTELWNIDWGFEEKAGKCGIVNTQKGVELCWGITEYGQNSYTIMYKLNGLVGAYEDYDGFNFQFVNSGMNTLPTQASVRISKADGTALHADNSGIWAFGFAGQINFTEGRVLANTEGPITGSEESVIIMLQLNKGVLHPIRKVSGTFEAVKNEAFKGSNYDTGSLSESTEEDVELGAGYELLGLGIILSPLALILLVLIPLFKRRKAIKNLYKNSQYFREAPIGGNLEASYSLANVFKQSREDGNIVAAAFLKLINTGCLEPITEKSIGFFGNEKESISLKLVHPPEMEGIAVNMLYELLVLSCGADQILQEHELQAYCTKNYTSMISITDSAKQDGESTLTKTGCYTGRPKANLKVLTERGKTLLLEIMGFKKYLLDFSLIGERTISESVIWQDYLVFAALLGIADKAMEQFKKVYPTVTPYQEHAQYHYYLAYRYHRAFYTAAISAQNRASGGGGRSSFGGGGGFSGGGGGGGTR